MTRFDNNSGESYSLVFLLFCFCDLLNSTWMTYATLKSREQFCSVILLPVL